VARQAVESFRRHEEGTAHPAVLGEPYHEWRTPDQAIRAQFFAVPDGYLIRFPAIADFGVSRDGRFIECWPSAGADVEDIEHLFLNQVWPLAQGRVGRLMFHASAVALNDSECLAFCGPSGKGKSTLAASFAQGGYAFLTDDGLALEEGAAGWLGFPAHVSLRLWPQAARALALEGSVRSGRKHRFHASTTLPACSDQRRLRAFYFLGADSPEIHFEPMDRSQVLIELTRNSFLLETQERSSLASHFDRLSNLVSALPFFRLDYPRNFERLGEVHRAILLSVAEISS
jgi:hypothetical protein